MALVFLLAAVMGIAGAVIATRIPRGDTTSDAPTSPTH